jgi:peptidoglycan/LPS O-acetylase OafA/YrhL
MTAPQSRPRVVTAAFWCWVVASLLLVLFGLMLALSRNNLPLFYRGAGALFILAGLALGYFAGRTRLGYAPFRRAAVGLALALALLLALFSLMTHGIVWLLVMILSMVGAVLIMRPSAQDWFEAQEQS